MFILLINYDRGISASFVLATEAPPIYNKVLRGDFYVGKRVWFQYFFIKTDIYLSLIHI